MTYDAIIIGLGGMGSAALWHLARRGCRVHGIDQFGIAHDRGSSHGGSRLIRRAYFEHPDYVPLVSRAYELWAELERASEQKLFHCTGLFLAGRESGAMINGVLRASKAHKLEIVPLSHDDARRRFPAMRATPEQTILYEPDAGFLEVEKCVQAHLEQAIASGAHVSLDTRVDDWTANESGVAVRTASGTIHAGTLLVCGGSWSGTLFTSMARRLEIRRKVVVWFSTRPPGYRVSDGTPVFCFDTESGFFYGFPSLDGASVKVGEHSGGEPIARPEALDRTLHATDLAPLERFIGEHLPFAQPQVLRHSVCMYTMTPDEHFIIDRHPNHKNVLVACGFSGHGFKFASVVGSVLADLATTGHTREPIGFLGMNRFAPTAAGT